MEIVCTDEHKYFVDGVEKPGVTEVLQYARFIDYSNVPEYILEDALERGSFVHLAIDLFNQGTLDEKTIDPSIEGYLEAYKRFLKDTRIKILESERKLYHKTFEYCGTLDLTGVLNKRKALLDYKTGVPLPAVAIQTAAYNACLDEPHDRYALQLKEDGKYSLSEPFTDPSDLKVFLNALSSYNWWKEHKC